ncbi:MAG TPA: hypothetical protein VFH81_00265 [Actinomycetota bacterium]|nr:hypothetical protein [Actinomycetota bacterium]
MEEFSALAARVAASVVELRGCLILSRDGLVLGAFPAGEEGPVKTAWLRFAVVGEPEKGFVEFGDEIWTYVRRGPYAAFAVSGLGVRPGLLIDQLDQMLYTAEEVRARREALRLPEVTPAPSGKPRTSLHPEARPSVPTPAPVTPPAQASPEAAPRPAEGSPEPSPAAPPTVPPEPAPSRPVPTEPPQPSTGSPPPERPLTRPVRKEEDPEVDRVALAQELSKLLQETGGGDENH